MTFLLITQKLLDLLQLFLQKLILHKIIHLIKQKFYLKKIYKQKFWQKINRLFFYFLII